SAVLNSLTSTSREPGRADLSRACSLYRGGSAKLRMRSPPRRPRSPPPDATVTNCSPFTMYTDGDEKTPDPVLNFHSRSPVFASKAKKYPAMLLPVPTNMRPQAVKPDHD